MKIKTAASLIAAAFALLAQGAYAADAASAPKSRADVKAETAAAAKNKELTPAGEGKQAAPTKAKSDKTRTEVKSDTAALEKQGKLAPAGEGKSTLTDLNLETTMMKNYFGWAGGKTPSSPSDKEASDPAAAAAPAPARKKP